jgi:hypothetical protein
MKTPVRFSRPLLLWFIPAVAAAVILFLYNPAEHEFYPVCMFHRLTGLNCPGCGSLRALHHLARGHWAMAFHFNPLLVLFLPFLTCVLFRQLWQEVTGRVMRPFFTRPLWGWLALGLIISFGVVRNLSFPPFIWLAP